ncbi:MAG: hypothetical protein U9Q38_05420 [Thermodesulfobacteriota bacterium]|nr:hypothetical protein [Thermodesulfobacteriota bacterium]
MGKKKYIKPEIREESQILTVRAWVTATQYQLAQPTTETSVAMQRIIENVSQTSQSQQEFITESSVFVQSILSRVFSRGRRP